MAKLNNSQKEQLKMLATCIEQTVNWPEETFIKTFQVSKEQAFLNQAKLLKHFTEKN